MNCEDGTSASYAQIKEYEKLLEDVKRAMDEGIDQPTEKSEAVVQLSDTITQLSTEKRCV